MLEDLSKAYLPPTRFPVRSVDRETCARCGRCIEACPTAGFVPDADGYPKPIGYGGFAEACLNCWNCVAVCPTGAMKLEGAYSVPEGRYKSTLTGEMRFPEPFPGDSRPYAEQAPELTETERVIFARRSNRIFKDKPVPKQTLQRLLEAARFAPSAGNCQPYKMVVVTNRDLIRELEHESMKVLRFLKNLYLLPEGGSRALKSALFTTLSLVMPTKMDPRPMTAMEKADQTDDIIYWNAPAVVFFLKNPRGISNPDLDIGMAAQNLVLAAHAQGLGTCYIGLCIEPLTYPNMKAMREKLGITAPWKPVTSVAIGWPKGKIDAAIQRDTPPIEWRE